MLLWARFLSAWRHFLCAAFGHQFTEWKEWKESTPSANPFLSQPTAHHYCKRCGTVEFSMTPPQHWDCRCTYTYPLAEEPQITPSPLAGLCNECSDQLTCPAAYDKCPIMKEPTNGIQDPDH